jgi:hypothetical protein
MTTPNIQPALLEVPGRPACGWYLDREDDPAIVPGDGLLCPEIGTWTWVHDRRIRLCLWHLLRTFWLGLDRHGCEDFEVTEMEDA